MASLTMLKYKQQPVTGSASDQPKHISAADSSVDTDTLECSGCWTQKYLSCSSSHLLVRQQTLSYSRLWIWCDGDHVMRWLQAIMTELHQRPVSHSVLSLNCSKWSSICVSSTRSYNSIISMQGKSRSEFAVTNDWHNTSTDTIWE